MKMNHIVAVWKCTSAAAEEQQSWETESLFFATFLSITFYYNFSFLFVFGFVQWSNDKSQYILCFMTHFG